MSQLQVKFLRRGSANEQHDLHPVINRTFSFDEAQLAFTELEQGKHFGKIAIAIYSSSQER
jgi:NADPH:quinone reductase-like Zn-dependent oxidoreductase